jgi:hypothetical protein
MNLHTHDGTIVFVNSEVKRNSPGSPPGRWDTSPSHPLCLREFGANARRRVVNNTAQMISANVSFELVDPRVVVQV